MPLMLEATDWMKVWLPELSWLEKILRPAAMYVFILLCLRIVGKKELSQMTLFDFVLLLLISEITQNAMVGDDFSIVGGWVEIAVLLGLSVLFDRIAGRSKRAKKALEGSATLLVYHGQKLTLESSRNQMGDDDLFATLRAQGIISLEQVRYAVLETTGELSVIKEDEARGAEECLTEELRKQIPASLTG